MLVYECVVDLKSVASPAIFPGGFQERSKCHQYAIFQTRFHTGPRNQRQLSFDCRIYQASLIWLSSTKGKDFNNDITTFAVSLRIQPWNSAKNYELPELAAEKFRLK